MSRVPFTVARREVIGLGALLGFAALAAALLPGTLRGRAQFGGDVQRYYLPQLDSLVASVAQGSWPVWDPLFGFGQPLWANPGNQILYPPTWLNLVVLPETYVTLYAAGHALWAALGTWAVARRVLGLSRLAAWLAAAGFMASGPFMSLPQRWQHFASAAWLPWTLLAAHRCVARPSSRRVLALGCVLSLQWLAGSVEFALATLVIALVWSTVATRPLSWPRLVRAWLPAGLLAAGLTAAIWVPALDLLSHSNRAVLIETTRLEWAVHPWRLIEMLAPLRPDELPLRPDLKARLLGATRSTIAPSLYLGAAMGGMALCALVASSRRRLSAGLAALAAASAVVAMGPHLLPGAWLEVAPLSILRFPGKLTLVVSFAWALLAGLGLDAWRTRGAATADRARVLPLASVGAALPAFGLALLAAVFPQVLARTVLAPPPRGARVWDGVWIEVLFCSVAVAAGALSAGLALLAERRPQWRTGCAISLVLVAVADLALPNHRLNPTVPAELVGRPPETAQRLREDGATRIHVVENEPRVDATGRVLPRHFDVDPRAPLARKEAEALGMNIALVGRSASRWGLAGSFVWGTLVVPTREQFQMSRLLRLLADQPAALPLLQAGAVSHVVTRTLIPPGLQVLATVPSPLLAPVVLLRVPDPLPRTYVVGSATAGSDDDALRFLFHGGAARRAAVVLADGPALSAPPGFSGTSRVIRWRPDELQLEVETSADAYLVLVEAFDPGWTASVDGHAARVHRANFAFRAVGVPPGRHLVRLRYRPRSVAIGVAVSALTLATALLALAARRRREVLRPPPTPR